MEHEEITHKIIGAAYKVFNSKQHEIQLVNYLNGLKKDIGLLINFGSSGVEVKRKYRKPSQDG